MSRKVQDELMNHEIDGIREFDNDLPPWWINMFYLTIVFAFVYYGYYHLFKVGPDQHQQYDAEVRIAEEAEKMRQGANGGDPFANAVALKSQVELDKGAAVFATNCAPCHGASAQGDVGPNLTDEYWIHGPRFADILRTIRQGVPDKGMVTWEGILDSDAILDVASYVVSLQGKKPENPKAPQGEKFDAVLVGQ